MTWACSSLQYFVSCSSIQDLPTLTFVISGVEFPLSPSAYILSVSPGPWGGKRVQMKPQGFREVK